MGASELARLMAVQSAPSVAGAAKSTVQRMATYDWLIGAVAGHQQQRKNQRKGKDS